MMGGRDARIVEHVASVAGNGLGQMSKAKLEQGWQRLADRLTQRQPLERPAGLHASPLSARQRG